MAPVEGVVAAEADSTTSKDRKMGRLSDIKPLTALLSSSPTGAVAEETAEVGEAVGAEAVEVVMTTETTEENTIIEEVKEENTKELIMIIIEAEETIINNVVAVEEITNKEMKEAAMIGTTIGNLVDNNRHNSDLKRIRRRLQQHLKITE